MATNLEIYALRTNADLLKRIEVAVARYATYLRGLGAEATVVQRDWARAVFEQQLSANIAQACAWEVVNDPIVRDAADVSLLPDMPGGGDNLQSVVEAYCLKYKGT